MALSSRDEARRTTVNIAKLPDPAQRAADAGPAQGLLPLKILLRFQQMGVGGIQRGFSNEEICPLLGWIKLTSSRSSSFL
jgi:hypothetical protein